MITLTNVIGFFTEQRCGSVRNRLALACALLIGSTALFIALYFPAQFQKEAIEGETQRSVSIAKITAYSVSAPLLFRDDRGVSDVLLAAQEDQNLYSINVRDERGLLVSSLRGPIQIGQEPEQAGKRPNLIVSSAPVLSQGRKIGTVDVALSLSAVDADVATTRVHISLVVIVLGLAAMFAIGKLVLAPLNAIVRATKRIAEGDFDSRAPVGFGDEFGFLAKSFNSMVDRLQGAHSDLTTVNRTLELRVLQRTEQLRHESDERLHADRERHRSEKRFRIMFESSPLGGVLFDDHGKVLESNTAMRQMLGEPNEDLLTTQCLASHLHTREHRTAWRQLRSLMRGKQDAVSAELRFLHGNGATIFTRVTLSAVSDASSHTKLAIMMVENVTEQRGLAEQLRQSQKLEAIGLLAGGIAHDFNNLLTTINGSAELLLEEHGTGQTGDDLREIMVAGTRAAGLTAQLLAFSRKQVLQPKVLDLNTVITDLGRMLRRLITENIHLELDLGPHLSSVKADPGQMEQVIMNLAINARDAMPAGGRLVIATDVINLTETQTFEYGVSEVGSYVSISVTDTGSGIQADLLEHIFEPFFTTKEVGKGTGLGLATVYGIVKQSGGGITVNSKVGRGTTFCIVFPCLAPLPDTEQVEAPLAPVGGKETILLVEDEEGVRSVIRRALQKNGYTVRECQNGREATAVFASEPDAFDALITDVVMPDVSGPQFVRTALELRPSVKVLYMSGYAREGITEQLERSTTMFIQKPVTLATLLHTLRDLLDSSVQEVPNALALKQSRRELLDKIASPAARSTRR